MRSPLYTAVFAEAWHMMWRHKKLLWFGFLASLIGSANVFDFLVNAYYRLRLETAPSSNVVVAVLGSILESGVADPKRVVLFSGFLLALSVIVGLVLLYFLVSAQGALISGAANYFRNKTIDLGVMWDQGRARFWPLFVINIIRLFILFAFLVIMAYPLTAFVMPTYAVMGPVSGFVLILLLMILGLFVSFIALYAGMFIVLRGHSTWRSIREALSLFKDHWLVSCEVGLLMFIANFVALLAAAAVLILISIPVTVLVVLYVSYSSVMFFIALVVLFVILLVLLAFIWSAYTTWIVSTWTALFLHMEKGALVSRILHWTRK
jgi:hypothetical protein